MSELVRHCRTWKLKRLRLPDGEEGGALQLGERFVDDRSAGPTSMEEAMDSSEEMKRSIEEIGAKLLAHSSAMTLLFTHVSESDPKAARTLADRLARAAAATMNPGVAAATEEIAQQWRKIAGEPSE